MIGVGPDGGTTFDFSTTPVSLTKNNSNMWHYSANASICDTLGNLLFYTNGGFVASGNHNPMWNGYNLEFGEVEFGPNDGINVPQSIIALPKPGSDKLYYLLYKSITSLPDQSNYETQFRYSLIDMSKNNGNGAVIEKNKVIVEGIALDWEDMTACKHANGQDWWIILGEAETNHYHRFLLTKEGIKVFDTQDVGLIVPSGGGQAIYSPKGDKYCRVNRMGFQDGSYLDFYDFDRCEGLLSNHVQIVLLDSAYSGGLAFSPNSRFLYVSAMNYVYQFDFESKDVQSTMEIVAVYDGFQNPLWNNFHLPQLAPDGKIYISCSNGTDLMHVINAPNEKGLACDLQQHSLQLPTQNAFSMPNFPNFNLGALAGSPCDTLGVNAIEETVKETAVSITPNPATTQIEVSIPFGYKEAMLTLYTATGQPVRNQRLLSGWSVVGLDGLAKGLYFWEVQDMGRVLGSGKLIVTE